jgi:sporulation protein YlmC with PRC-barrel domain
MTVELDLVDIKRVITKDGKDIGVVSACNLDVSTWKINSLIVNVEKQIARDLKMKKRLFRGVNITVQTNLVSNMTDVAQLSIDLAELKKQLAL